MPLHRIKITTHNDFEFSSTLNRTVEYILCTPEGEAKGLVVYIAGFGDDSGEYRIKFLQHVADTYSLAGVTIDYHCFFARPGTGATLSVAPGTMNLLRSLTGLTGTQSVDEVLTKAKAMKTGPGPLRVPGTIYPKNGEYQNFGVIPALDTIYSINDLFSKFPGIPKKIYAIGSSYGGYIANLVSKFAPCTLDAVFDNSSWASPNLKYVIGGDLGFPEFAMNYAPGIILDLNVVSPWSHLPQMPNAFNEDRMLIRSFPENHLDVMATTGNRKTIYRCIHAANDPIANTEQKVTLVKALKARGFDATVKVCSTGDVDGTYIKNMNHGMGLSMRRFFAACHEETRELTNSTPTIDADFEHTLVFPCKSREYVVQYLDGAQPSCIVR